VCRALQPHAAQLAGDPFANYLVKALLESSSTAEAGVWVTKHLCGHLLRLSRCRHGSNVVQAVLRVCGGSAAVRSVAAAELVQDRGALVTLVADPYGNYVLQTLVGSAVSVEELAALEAHVRCVVALSPFATNIMAKITARYMTLVPLRRPRARAADAAAATVAAKPCRCARHTWVNCADSRALAVAVCAVEQGRCAADEQQLLSWLRELGVRRDEVTYRNNPYGIGKMLYKGHELAEAWVARALCAADCAQPPSSPCVATATAATPLMSPKSALDNEVDVMKT
jgi:hypothetical protein